MENFFVQIHGSTYVSAPLWRYAFDVFGEWSVLTKFKGIVLSFISLFRTLSKQ